MRVSCGSCENMGCPVTETHEADATSDLVTVARYDPQSFPRLWASPFLAPLNRLCVRLGEEVILHLNGLTNS